MLLELLEYFFLALPLVLFSLWAQAKVLRASYSGSLATSVCGLTGAEMAELLLSRANVAGVTLEALNWELGNFYDAREKVLFLSPAVFHGNSLTALAIAAHEVGHAMQDAAKYRPIWLRNTVVPMASLGSQLFWLLIAGGFLLSTTKLIFAAIVLLAAMLVLQSLNLPAEYDASRRALTLLAASGMIRPEEESAIARMLKAIPWTYIAAVFCGLWLQRLLLRYQITR